MYKIVQLRNDHECSVLTLGGGRRWRLVSLPPTYVSRAQGSLVVVNGAMYVLVSCKRVDGKLVCFDLEREEWKKKIIQGPKNVVVSSTDLP
jgi:hypothetical protein